MGEGAIERARALPRSLPVALAPPAESSTSVPPSVRPSVDAVQRSKVFFEANVGVAERARVP